MTLLDTNLKIICCHCKELTSLQNELLTKKALGPALLQLKSIFATSKSADNLLLCHRVVFQLSSFQSNYIWSSGAFHTTCLKYFPLSSRYESQSQSEVNLQVHHCIALRKRPEQNKQTYFQSGVTWQPIKKGTLFGIITPHLHEGLQVAEGTVLL